MRTLDACQQDSPQAVNLSKPRLLMIDNNRGDLELIRIAFEEAEFPVMMTSAESGAEGQALLTRVEEGLDPPYLLTLLDLNMPGMSGHDVLIWARSQKSLAQAPIVILTSSSSHTDRRRCMSEGATDVLVKPATFGAVLALVVGLRSYLHP
jgi:CheY-like chemotaxis protein